MKYFNFIYWLPSLFSFYFSFKFVGFSENQSFAISLIIYLLLVRIEDLSDKIKEINNKK